MNKGARRIGIIGHFGGPNPPVDGQTVKTQTLCRGLIEAGVADLYVVDTWYNRESRRRLIRDTVCCLRECDRIVLLVSSNGLRLYLPLLFLAHRVLGTRLFFDAIGENVKDLLASQPSWARMLDCFERVWVETEGCARAVRGCLHTEVEVIPNFKSLENVSAPQGEGPVRRFCTFSRVMPEKGVTEAVRAVAAARELYPSADLTLNIWGPVEPSYSLEFENLVRSNEDFVSYCGIVPPGESVGVLAGQDVLLFPTRWASEGFPGTIVDAFSAGLPVVASDWNSNGEVVEHLETGLVYPAPGIPSLVDAVRWCVENPGDVRRMALNCVARARDYTPGPWIAKIVEELG